MPIEMVKALALTLVFSSVMVGSASAADMRYITLDAGMDKLRGTEHGAPAISVALVEHGRIVHAYATGASTATPFRAASITKMVTAVSVMQLVESGAISSLDDVVGKYLPGAPHGNAITIRQLLSHSSGFPDTPGDAIATGAAVKPTTPAAIMADLAKTPLDFTPDERYGYSNANYVVLGQLVEKLRGEPLAQVEREHIFAPAGMTQSSFEASAGESLGFDPSWLYGAGDLVTTPSDLARFDIALASGKLISKKTFAEMQQGGRPMSGSTLYALGVMTTPFGDETLVGHHGGIPGYATENEMTGDGDYAVVVMGDSTSFQTSLVNWLALRIVDDTDLEIASREVAWQQAHEAATVAPTLEDGFRAFLSGVSRGRVDRSTLSKPMSDALMPQTIAHLAAMLPSYELLRTLTVVSHQTDGTRTIYTFAADYGTKTIDYRYVLDPDGKIAGFFEV